MYKFLKLIFLLGFVSAEIQDPRKRYLNSYHPLDELELNKNEDEEVSCGSGLCIKGSSGQDEMGPFWANRGKKNPSYMQEPLFASEPYWVYIRRDEQEEPFFTSRGKKESKASRYINNNVRLRERREFINDVDSPFFAARGKKLKLKNDKL